MLFKLVQRAQEQWPGKKRHLFLDIDAHRNSKGGFDADMFELQKEFLMNYLSQFLTVVTTPLFQAENEKPQDDAIPAELVLRERRKKGD